MTCEHFRDEICNFSPVGRRVIRGERGSDCCGERSKEVESPQTLLQARRTADRGGPVRAPEAPRRRPRIDGDAVDELLIGRYRLLEHLGEGGFGVVWRAHDELLRREVAVKRIPRARAGDRDRASREALAAARLSHPAIVALFEACETDDSFYLISELVHGETLARLIAQRALEDAQVFAIGEALASALAHAHTRGVVHRDVKPGNVIVPHAFLDAPAREDAPDELDAPPRTGAPGATAAAKLTDFGGAWMSGAEALTRTGDVLGTIAYMAPEQADGRDVAEPADLYSLALVLYETLCGENPMRGATPAETVRRIGGRAPSLARARPALPRAVSDALDRALQPRPRSRGTLAELGETLARARRIPAGARERARVDASEDARASPFGRAVSWTSADTALAHSALAPRREPRLDAAPADTVRAAREARLAHAAPAASAAARAALSGAEEPRTLWRPRRVDVEAPASAEEPELAVEPTAPARRARLASPRALVLGGVGAAIAWQAVAGRAGLALLLLAASLPLLLLPRRGSGAALLSALAPALGSVGLAGAFPAIAGQARAWRTRAALGALAYWWLTLAEPLSSQRLWLGTPHALPPRAVWESSVSSAFGVLTPMLSLGTLLGAGVWAAGALCLPLLARGRSALADALGVASWSVALVIAAHSLDGPLPAGALHGNPRGAVVGALFGAAIALGARALRVPIATR
jgi:serine/threonine protein kinase